MASTRGGGTPTSVGAHLLPAAWLTLDENDNDPTTFLRYVIAALRTVAPEACRDTLALLHSPQRPPHTLLLTTLINDLVLLPQRLILVLDDYAVIRNPMVVEVVTKVVRGFLPQLHLLILTREVGDLPLTYLRVYDAVIEIRSHDLRFSRAETAAYLHRALLEPLADGQVDMLEKQMEGWVAGLKMAVLLQHSGRIAASALHGGTAQQTTVRDFLAAEVLERQPPAVQTFLLKSAVADQFCAALCQALVEPGQREENSKWDARACIQWLVRSDLFVVSLSPQGDWYRYHPLFLSMLRDRGAAALTPAGVQELHRRAAGWYAEQGLIDEAIQHALAANDLPLASAIMWRALPTVLNHEDRPTLERWLGLLPEDFVQVRPELLLIRAWSLQFRWQLPLLAETVRQIELLLEDKNGAGQAASQGEISPDVAAQVAIFCGQAAFLANRPQQAIDALQRARELLLPSATYLRGGTMLYLGISLQASGQFAEAERLLLAHHELCLCKCDGFALRLCLSLCFCYSSQGRLEPARQIAHDMLVQAQNSELPTLQSWAHYFLGWVHYQWNDLTAAQTHFDAVLARRYLANMAVIRAGMSQLALLHDVRGSRHEAWQILDLLTEIDLEHYGREDDATRAMRAWLALRMGDSEAAGQWATAFTTPPANAPLLWLANPHVIKVRILLACGGEADLKAAASLLNELLAIAIATFNIRAEIELLALQAAVLHASGRYDAAVASLRQAVAMAQPGGFVRVFVDTGPQLRAILLRLSQYGLAVRHLLGAFAPNSEPAPAASLHTQGAAHSRSEHTGDDTTARLLVPLTAREMDVLTLLREPLSTKEIARRLGITHATLKRHTINLYGKLSVNTRWDAVTSGERLGYLEPN
jgi:LuxR family maltose regulon positive regulatory protein